MTDWIPIAAGEVNKPRSETIRGVKVNVYLSPYDVPDGVRGYFDAKKKKFVIEFKYIAEEPKRSEVVDEHVSVTVGRRTGRLHAIEVDTVRLKANAVMLQTHVPKAVDDAIAESARKHQQASDNYSVAGEIVEDRKEDLFKELVPA